MRKIIVSEMVTVDGYFAGPKGEIDWHRVDAEFNEFAVAQLDTADAFLFGRVTYDLMAGYWPTPAALNDDPRVAERMNRIEKIVFSRTEEKLAWNNSRVLMAINPEEIKKMKAAPGKHMLVFGSGTIVQQLANLQLIDEYRLFVNPVVLGKGMPLFANIEKKFDVRFLHTKTFKNGNVLLCYEPAGK